MEYALIPQNYDSFARLTAQHAVEANLPQQALRQTLHDFEEWMSKRISSLMEKLNRKRVCMSDNRVILGTNCWTFTSSRIREYSRSKISLISKRYNLFRPTQNFLWLCIVVTTKLLKQSVFHRGRHISVLPLQVTYNYLWDTPMHPPCTDKYHFILRYVMGRGKYSHSGPV